MNRAQAIQWCKDNNCNFIGPVFHPPEDWMWCQLLGGIYLTKIFTADHEEDIFEVDV